MLGEGDVGGVGDLVIPKYSSFPNTRHSRALVSVCRRASSFKRRLTDTYVLGNLPKVGTGFVGIHGSLREIPEGEENMVAYWLPIFYRSRMTK